MANGDAPVTQTTFWRVVSGLSALGMAMFLYATLQVSSLHDEVSQIRDSVARIEGAHQTTATH